MKTKSLNLIFIFFLLFFSNLSAQVKIKSVFAKNEICGTFCKTNLEITFYNPTNSDSLQGFFSFKALENSFVKEMWLEINGEFKKAETLRKRTAQRIYDRIVRRRIDPAILRKAGNGNYYLSVFPVNSKEERIIRIEYYSLLEGKSQNLTNWFLSSNRIEKKYLEINYTIPRNSYINYGKYFTNKNFINDTNNEIINGTIKKTEVEELTFDVYLGNEKFIAENDRVTFLTEFKSNHIFEILTNSDFIENVDQIMLLLKNKKSVFLNNSSQSIFIKKFVDYLNQNLNFFQNYENNFPFWFKVNGDLVFIQDNYSASQITESTNYQPTIKCDYLSNYTKYNELLLEGENAKMNSGFLFQSTAKLVIEENDRRAVEIREEELYKEVLEDKEIGSNSPREEIPVEFFVAVEEMPQPIGGIAAIQQKIIYPEIAIRAGVQGRVYVKAFVDKFGFVRKTEVIKGIGAGCDEAAVYAVKRTRFKPGKQRGKPVGVQVSIPVLFKFGVTSTGNSAKQNSVESVEIENKKFNIIITDKYEWLFFEEIFNKNRCEIFEYVSEKSFNFLTQNPDQIKCILTALEDYSFDGIGLFINGKSYLFTRK